MNKSLLVWNDGRSGIEGCRVGNVVLGALAGEFGEFRKHRSGGTTFETDGHVWIARVVARGYLGEGDAHWANASYSQFARVVDQTNRVGKQLVYLFITALPGEDIRYWIVPGSLIGELFERRGKAEDGGTTTIHIKDREGASWLDGVDVSACERRVDDPDPEADRDPEPEPSKRELEPRADAGGEVEGGSGASVSAERVAAVAAPAGPKVSPRVRTREPARPPVSDHSRVAAATRSFEIPLSGGRVARLVLPYPVGEVDVERVTKWIDLMRDVLTEGDASNATATEKEPR